MLKLIAPFVILFAAIFAVVASDKPDPPADFTFINRGDVTTLDPQRMSWMQDLRVARLLFEPLVRLDVMTKDYEIVPGVAERWEVSDDFRDYTFHIRDDARWSNGEPVTAQQFVYSWRRALLPETAADYTALFQAIDGATDFFEWRSEQTKQYAVRARDLSAEERLVESQKLWDEALEYFDENVALKAVDDKTLTMSLTASTPYWLDLCAFIVFAPVYEPLVSQYEQVDPDTGLVKLKLGWTKPPLLIGNGPFVLEGWRFKRSLFLRSNPEWWAKDTLDIDTIAIPSVEDSNSQVLAFESGSVHWISDVNADYRIQMLADKQAFYDENREQYEVLKAQGLDAFSIDAALPDDPRKNIHALSAFGTYWYNFNCLPTLADGRENPFHDARVRRAFAMCIDKQRICDDVMRIGNIPARNMFPPGAIAGYESPAGLDCISDATNEEEKRAIIDKAKALLADAGYPNPAEMPRIEVLFNSDGGHGIIAQQLAKDWEEFLGVRTVLAQKEIKVYKDDLKKHNFMTGRAGWFADYADPTTFLDLNRTGDGNNDRAYSSEVYDGLLDQAKLETDTQKRLEILSEAEQLIMEEDMPLVPLFYYVNIYLFDPDEITGISLHPRLQQDLFNIDVLGDGKGRDKVKDIYGKDQN
jgi:oligopeptide transport system substrate-binding protein